MHGHFNVLFKMMKQMMANTKQWCLIILEKIFIFLIGAV